MLKLEKVELRGFKSFCDYTEITFPSHITAIVGPNGTGKSNVADGITWVLGEQSARSLRGTRMEDLIFQGSRARPAVGMAEVNLTLLAKDDIHLSNNGSDADESEQEQTQVEPRTKKAKLARKISAGELITVTRRLYRSGESEYLIDGQHSRLRDIHDLFAGTGLGPGHYAIIGQDRVAELINAKPFERRGVIEEAAGITKFKLRQRAIEVRLESSKQNLLRLNDIITEIERQVGGLKRQAARARRYRRLREELRMLLRVMFRSEFHRIEAELAAVGEAVEGLEKEKEQTGAEIVSLEAEHRDVVHSGRSGESYVTEVRDQLAKLDLEIDRVQTRQAHCREQAAEFTSRRLELQREEQALVERRDVVVKESERLNAQLAELSSELESDHRQLDARERAYQERLALVRTMEQELETLRLRFINEINNTANLRNARHQLDEAIRRLETQRAGLAAERQRAEGRRLQLIEERQHLGATIAAHQVDIESLRAAKNESARKLEAARRQAASEQAALSEMEKRRIALENRRTSLIELDERHAYYSQAVQHLFETASNQNGLRLLGTLADYTHVMPENERMVEAFMSERLQAVLVPSLEEARFAAELLDSAAVGRAQFLVVGVSGGQQADVVEAVEETGASDGVPRGSSFMHALGLDEAVSRVVIGAYPDCRTAEIVPDLTTAIESSVRDESRVFVTRNGEWARGGWLVSGGADSDKALGLLAVKREIRELGVELSELTQRIETSERLLGERSSEIESLDLAAKDLDAALQEREKTLFEHEHRLSELERDLFRVEQQLKVIEFESSEASRERETLTSERASVVSDLEKAEAGLKRLEEENKKVQDGLADVRQGADSLAGELSGLRIQLAAKSERRNSVALQLRRLENERAETEERIERNRFEAARLEAELATLEQAVRELAASFESLSAERAETEGRLTTATASLTEARHASDLIEERLTELRRSESELRDRLSQIEVTRAQLISEAKYLNEACQAELAQSLEEVLGMVENEETTTAASVDMNDPAAVRGRVEELRRKIEEIGPVNMMALEELQQTEERLRFLKTQREDIEKSIVSTEQGLQEIKRRSRQRFADAFEAINENFKEMFRELFGGGQGQMVLLDPENVLESGIDIIAQPPGKKLQTIHLLSGGEKAMTALSLLLAIFRFRPSPFCILDEVDAPLDDVNVGRFSQKIAEMSQHTQFILITHNKDTMEAAESLYGVTMEEPGVSKLISVRLK